VKIAFVSYEYPPETAFGGIATYVEQAALMLSARGHAVEVFSASTTQDSAIDQQGVRVHRVFSRNKIDFYREIFPLFSRRHGEVKFDVVETPDYKHDGYWIAKKIPDLAHVVRLHSANHSSSRLFLVDPRPEIFWDRLRRLPGVAVAAAGAIKRGLLWRDPEGFSDYLMEIWNEDRNDRRTAELADIIASPCLDLLKFQIKEWDLAPAKVELLPYPYVPSPAMLEIPCGSTTKTVGFFGQLSERKGLRALGQALPLIFQRHPDARFLFIGKPWNMRSGKPFPDYLREQAGTYRDRLEFTGQVELKNMSGEYARVAVCVFPSLWENFPNVCLEAMSAGRAIAASWNGGMAEMLDGGQSGLLFPPNSPERLAESVCLLLDQPGLCLELGKRARARVLERYCTDEIAPLQETIYRRAIENRRASINSSSAR
jgi:glycogen(starch) synthase